MEKGEIYGALLRRLNQQVNYINCSVIEKEVEDDENDVKAFMAELWQKGIVRRINGNEYELLCTIDQLREHIIGNDSLETGGKRGEFEDEGNKPLTIETLTDAFWKTSDEEGEERKDSRRGPTSPRYRDRRRPFGRRPLSSFLDDDDDEDEDDIEEKRKRILNYIKEMPKSNMEEHTFVPYMTVHFPNSDKQLVLNWSTDSEGDIYLSDMGIFYRYLLEKLNAGEEKNTEALATAVMNKLGRTSSFGIVDNQIRNYLTNVDDKSDFDTEVNYYASQLGSFLNDLSGLFEPLEKNSAGEKKTVQEKIEDFLEKFSIVSMVLERPSAYAERITKRIIKRFMKIDPRLTKEQLMFAIEKAKDKCLKNPDTFDKVQWLNEAINELPFYSDAVYYALMVDTYYE